MKKIIFVLSLLMIFCFSACTKCCSKAIELMGAGDRIHDTFTFANVGVKIKETEKNIYKISGSVEKLEDEDIKNEFNIDEDVDHVVAIKLSSMGKKVDKTKLQISVDGVRSYDAEHLNGSDYTFIILEAVKSGSVSIEVQWNQSDKIDYIIQFDENLILK